MQRRAESSALDEKVSCFERENLIAHAEVRRREPLNDHKRWLEVPNQDESDKKRCQRLAKLGVVPPWSVRYLFDLGHRYVDVTAALVIRVRCHAERVVLTVFALLAQSLVIAPVRIAMPALSMTTLFVRPTALNRNAKHLSRSKHDQPLCEEQEHGDEFDQSGGHQ